MCGCSVTERYLYSVRLNQPSIVKIQFQVFTATLIPSMATSQGSSLKNAPVEDINGQHPNNEIIQKTTCIERPIFYLMIYVPMLH